MSTTWTVKKLNVFLPSSSQGVSECRPKTQNFKKKDNKGQQKPSKWLSLFHHTYISNPHIWPPYFGRFFPHKMESVKPVKKPPKIEVGWPTQNSPAFRFIFVTSNGRSIHESTNPRSTTRGMDRCAWCIDCAGWTSVRWERLLKGILLCLLLRYIICVCISYIFWVDIHCIYIYIYIFIFLCIYLWLVAVIHQIDITCIYCKTWLERQIIGQMLHAIVLIRYSH